MLKKVYRPLDLLLAAVYCQKQGQMEKAGRLFVKAATHPQMEHAWAELDQLQQDAHVMSKGLAVVAASARRGGKKVSLSQAMSELQKVLARKKVLETAIAKRKKVKADADVTFDGEPPAEGDDALDLSADPMDPEEVVSDEGLDDLQLDGGDDDGLAAADGDDDILDMPEANASPDEGAEDETAAGDDAPEEEESDAKGDGKEDNVDPDNGGPEDAKVTAKSRTAIAAANVRAIKRFVAATRAASRKK